MSSTAGPGPSDDRRTERARLHRDFVPRRARVVALVLALLVVLGLSALGASLPDEYGLVDRLGFVVGGLLVAAFLLRQARVRVDVDEEGLEVRNLFLDRRLEWAQVVAVRFGGGMPWLQLDLADGETLSVMAVQRADGPRAEDEARRLATLVELHTPRDPR